MVTVGIHQPNFLPWLGYFYKMLHSDVFILYDDCTLNKQSWTTRVKIRGAAGAQWLSVPVKSKGRMEKPISLIPIDDSTQWRKKAVRTLTQIYGKAPYFDEAADLVLPVLENYEFDSLSKLNIAAIEKIANALEVNPRLICSSNLPGSGAKGTARLVELVQAVEGECYLSGDGSDSYLEPGMFAEAGLSLKMTNFKSPSYPQANQKDHLPALSIFDALANVGKETAAVLLAEAVPPR
jgi:hypothetical protein